MMDTTDLKYFDRQERIPDWKQEAVNSQIALLLGVGGLGCSVALACCRLGFKKIIIVDKDKVEAHNLNRQVLFSKSDIGRQKVVAAAESLKLHDIHTEIETHDIDVLPNWHKIVEMSTRVTAIFNMIDIGDYFDAAVASLALKRKLPLISGGTFRTSLTVDFFRPEGNPCWLCSAGLEKKDLRDKLVPTYIDSIEDLSFIPEDAKPTGASTATVAATCAMMMTHSLINYLHGKTNMPTRTIFYYDNFDCDKWEMAPEKECVFCNDPCIINNAPVANT